MQHPTCGGNVPGTELDAGPSTGLVTGPSTGIDAGITPALAVSMPAAWDSERITAPATGLWTAAGGIIEAHD